jgi:hypothetical protein
MLPFHPYKSCRAPFFSFYGFGTERSCRQLRSTILLCPPILTIFSGTLVSCPEPVTATLLAIMQIASGYLGTSRPTKSGDVTYLPVQDRIIVTL